jgi:hypothetical protein
MVKSYGVSGFGLVSGLRSDIPSSFLVSVASLALIVEHIKSNNEQISRVAEWGLLPPAAFSINIQRDASIGISR